MSVKDPENCQTMTEVRAGVDDVDARIVALIARRFGYMDAAARIKPDRSAVRDEQRKAEVLAHVKGLADAAAIDPVPLVRLWNDLIEASIEHEYRTFDRLNA